MRKFILAAVVWGCAIAATVWIMNVKTGGGALSPPLPDSLLYHQYARSIATGHPYQFTPGQAASTGSTGHLYPWLLAVPEVLGASGAASFGAAFILGLIGYITTLLLVCAIAHRLSERAVWPAFLFTALNGQVLTTALSDTDMSLFVPLALGAIAALLHHRRNLGAVLLFLAAATRPEGALLAGGMVLAGLVAMGSEASRGAGRSLVLAGLGGLAGAALVLALNFAIAGSLTPASVTGKSYFLRFPLAGAIQLTAKDIATLFRGLFAGLDDTQRSITGLTLPGLVFLFLGLCSRRGDTSNARQVEGGFLLAAAASIALLASSGWASSDRYLGWILPMAMAYAATGLADLARRWESPAIVCAGLILLGGLQATGLVYAVGAMASAHRETRALCNFAREVHETLPPQASVGVLRAAGVAYVMPGRNVVNVSGVVSPQFAPLLHSVENIETLKHDSRERFDFWFVTEDRANDPEWYALIGERVLGQDVVGSGREPYALFKADWTVFKAMADGLPVKPAILKEIADLKLVDRLDVQSRPDEISHQRTTYCRIPGTLFVPFAEVRKLGDQTVMEVGDVIVGAETFTISASPGKPVRMVMRTASVMAAGLTSSDGRGRVNTFTFASPLTLRILADGQPVGDFAANLNTDSNAFDEVMIDLPGAAFRAEKTRLTIGGDHVSCAYWFYQ